MEEANKLINEEKKENIRINVNIPNKKTKTVTKKGKKKIMKRFSAISDKVKFAFVIILLVMMFSFIMHLTKYIIKPLFAIMFIGLLISLNIFEKIKYKLYPINIKQKP